MIDDSADVCLPPFIYLYPQGLHSLTCATAHTATVLQVLAWGSNSHGQLGLGDRRDRSTPTVVGALWALPIIQLAAGDTHSAALTSNGHLFMWGSNNHGQLGLARELDREAAAAAGRTSRSSSSSSSKK